MIRFAVNFPHKVEHQTNQRWKMIHIPVRDVTYKESQ